MELKDFIAQTLVQIINGISSAQDTLGSEKEYINPHHVQSGDSQKNGVLFAYDWAPIENVEFDVAITASDTADVGTRIGVTSGIINARLGGKGEQSTELVNRIKFSVPICYPRKRS